MARRLATLFADVLRIRRDVIDENLRHAFPEMTAAERRDLDLADVGALVPDGHRGDARPAEDSRHELARLHDAA